jgi:cytoskeletal protein CcmA (bactofilin family)
MKIKKMLRGMAGWHITVLVFMLLFIAFGPPVAQAEVPRYINYQGKLTDSDDNPITDEVDITVRIYNAVSGGTALWTETQTVTVTKGIFNMLLGSTTALTSLDFNSAYWYSVEVESDGEMTPRQRLTAVGYAINADKLDGYNATDFLAAAPSGALSLTGGANENIEINPTGTGDVVVTIDSTSGDFKITDGTTNFVLVDNATGNVTIAKDLTVSGTIYGTIASTGGSSTFTTITVTGASDLKGNIANSAGNLTIADALTQTGSSNQVTFAGNVDAGNGLDVTGALTVSSTSTLTGAVDLNSNMDLDYSGSSAALDVTQTSTGPAAQFSGQRVIVGANETTNANALSTGELYVLGDLEVDGTIYGNISSSGSTSLGSSTLTSLTVSGTSDLQGNISDSGGVLTVADNTALTPSALTSGGTDDYALSIAQTLNDTGAAGGSDVYRGIKVNLTETNKTGWNNVYLMDLQVGGTSKFYVDDSGNAVFTGTVTGATPTTGSHLVTKDYADAITPSSAGGWTDTGSKVYLLTAGDNVGVGTTNPTQKLEVIGTVKATTLSDGTFAVTGGAVTGATGNISMWTNDSGYITNDTSVAKNHLTNSGALSFDWADDEVADNLTISSGTINNSIIGGSTPAAGTFSALNLTNTAGTPTFTFTDSLGSDTLTYDSDGAYPFYFSDKISVQDILLRGSSPAVLTFGTGTSSINLIYDPATDAIRFSRGTFAQDFRNLVKNGSFESFSAMEAFHTYDTGYTTATTTATEFGGLWNKTYGYQGGWQDFAPDDWAYVSGDVFQHSPLFFETGFTSSNITSNTYKQDFAEGVSAVRMAAITAGTPPVTTAGKISQTITGLKPSTVYSVGVKMRVETGGSAQVDITGEDTTTSTTLSSNLDSTATSISVADVSSFPAFGTIRIITGGQTEKIRYEGLDNTAGANKFLKCTRGAYSTTAIAHNSGDTVIIASFTALTTTTDTTYKKFEGQFATDPKASNITILLSAEAGVAYFDTVQVVAGGTVPEYTANTVVDTGDQTIYGSLRIGRSSDEKGGVLSVDKFVRARGVELFKDDPGLTGASGGGTVTLASSGVFPPGSGWNNITQAAPTVQLYVSGNYSSSAPPSRDYKVVVDGTSGTSSTYSWWYMDSTTSWAYQSGGSNISMPTASDTLLSGSANAGVKIRFSSSPGNAGDTWWFHASNESCYQSTSYQQTAVYTPGKTRIYVDPDPASSYYNKLVFEDGTTKVSLAQLAGTVTTSSYIGAVNRWSSNTGYLSMYASGSYTNTSSDTNYKVQIWANGTGTATSPSNDTFKYSTNGGASWSSETQITGSLQSVGNGVYISFSDPNYNGYYLSGIPGDTWTFTAFKGATGSDKVASLNTKTGALSIEAGSNISIDYPTTSQIRISASGVDSSSTNELNTSMGWNNGTNEVSVTDAGGTRSVVITGFLESEVDGSTTNEINTFTADTGGATTGLAVTLAGSGIVSTSRSGDTITISATEADGSITNELPTAGSDIDVTGTEVSIEPQLDTVTTINRTGANLTLKTTTSGDILMTPAGNVGIGTTATSAPVDILGTSLTNAGTDDKLISLAQTLNDTTTAGGTQTYTGLKFALAETDKTGWDNVNLIDLQAGATPASKFKVDDSGNTTIAGTLTIGSTLLSSTAATSGASLVGTYDEFTNSNSSNVQDVLDDLDAAISTSGIQNLWETISSQSGSTQANTTTDTLTINGGGIATTAISGDTLTITATEADTLQTVAARGATYTGGITLATSGGNVGIGTTSASQKLDVNGDIIANHLELRGGSPATITFGEGSNAKSLQFDPNTREFSFTGGKLAQQFQNLIRSGSFEGAKPTGWIMQNATYGTEVNIITDAGLAKFGSKLISIADNSGTLAVGMKFTLPSTDRDRLKGKKATISLWSRTNSGQARASVAVYDGVTTTVKNIPADANPQTYLSTTYAQYINTFDISASATEVTVLLYAAEGTEPNTVVASKKTNDYDANATQVYFDGLTLVEGALALDYGPAPIFDTGPQVIYGSLAIGADVSPNTGGVSKLIFGEPPSDFGLGTGYGWCSMGAGTIQYEQWGADYGRFMINRGIKILPGGTYGSSLHLMGQPYGGNTVAMFLMGSDYLTNASSSGTFIGVNAQSFNGDFINLQNSGTTKFKVDKDGNVTAASISGGAVQLNSSGALENSSGLKVRVDNSTININGSNQLALASAYSDGSTYDSRFVNASGGDTMTGTLTLSGITSDIVTPSGEHLSLMPGGTGNVGIGSTSPAQKLDVAGNIALTGTVDGYDLSAKGSNWDAAYTHKTSEDAINGLVFVNGAGTYSAKVIGTDVQAYNANLADLADGELTGSKVGTGIAATNISSGTLSTDRYSAYSDLQAENYLGDNADTDLVSKLYVDNAIAGLSWKEAVKDKDLTAPPGSPATNDRYIIASSATGDWSGHDLDLTRWTGSSWTFEDGETSDAVFVDDEVVAYVFNGSAWVQFTGAAAYSWGTGLSSSGSTINVGAGTGIDVDATNVIHEDMSSQANVDNSNGNVIQDITLDASGLGHITGITSTDLDSRYYTETEANTNYVNVSGDTMTGDLTIIGGTINNSIIGGSQAAAGTFTNLTASGTLNFPDNSVSMADINWNAGQILVTPDYPNASVYGDGTANNGTLALKNTADANWRNYYEWTSQNASLQDYTIIERYVMPPDFSSWASSNAITLNCVTQSVTDTSNKVDIVVYKSGSGSAIVSSLANVSSSAGTWADVVIDDSTLGTWNAGDILVVEIKPYSKSGNYVRVGDITLNYTR